MTCIDANTVQAYLGGRASADARERIEAHVDGCEDCRALVAASARLGVAADEIGAGGRISRYVLGPQIGGGTMGVVFAAEDPELRRAVAIKLVFLSARDADPRALSEAQALARVSHPNVVSVFDVGTHGGHLFLAMELVDGGDLRAWLAAAPRSVAEIVGVLADAGRGLAAAHAAGLVHRDLKPDNILVGRDGRVRVGDFGLAIAAASASEVAGTPAYMAPEQLAGGAVDARSDQFSLCATLYEALYGRRPFADPAAHRAGRVRDEPRGRVPAALRRVVVRGLDPRPEGRYPAMGALVAALERARPRPSVRRALVAAALVVLATGSVLAVDATARARDLAAGRAALAAAGDQVAAALALRFDTFDALAQVTSVLPILREVAGNVDRAEFGLGDAAVDAHRLELLHDNLASADWSLWTAGGRSFVAVADYKGRLVYSSAAPAAFGADLRGLEAVARTYDPEQRTATVMLIADDDPTYRAARLVDGAGAGVTVLVAGAAIVSGTPRAVFVQGIDARRVLADVAPSAGVALAIQAPGGQVVGGLPPGIAADAATREARAIGDWLVVGRPVTGLDDPAPFGRVILARPLGRGLWAPLLPLRPWLAGLALALAAALIARAVRRANR